MAETKRGHFLTLFAILLVFLAIEDLTKPLMGSGTATVSGARVQGSIVFFGMRLQGSWMYLGWVVAAFLLTLAVGVWRMRRYASLMANCYAGYALLNVAIYTAIHPLPKNQAEVMFAVVYETIAVAGAWTLAILLRRKRASDLSWLRFRRCSAPNPHLECVPRSEMCTLTSTTPAAGNRTVH